MLYSTTIMWKTQCHKSTRCSFKKPFRVIFRIVFFPSFSYGYTTSWHILLVDTFIGTRLRQKMTRTRTRMTSFPLQVAPGTSKSSCLNRCISIWTIYTYIYTNICVSLCVCVYGNRYIVCVCACTCACIHIHMNMYAYQIHTYKPYHTIPYHTLH